MAAMGSLSAAAMRSVISDFDQAITLLLGVWQHPRHDGITAPESAAAGAGQIDRARASPALARGLEEAPGFGGLVAQAQPFLVRELAFMLGAYAPERADEEFTRTYVALESLRGYLMGESFHAGDANAPAVQADDDRLVGRFQERVLDQLMWIYSRVQRVRFARQFEDALSESGADRTFEERAIVL